MKVTVTPIQTINVKINSQNQSRVQTINSFVGASDIEQQVQIALESANTALILAESAYSLANGLSTEVQTATNLSNTAIYDSNTALFLAELAYSTANVGYNFVNYGGTVTGNIIATGDIFGTIDGGTFT